MTAPTRSKAHPVVVAAAVLLVVVVCGSGAVELLSRVAHGAVEQTSTFTPAVERVRVESQVGHVSLTPSSDGRVHVRTAVQHGPGEPEIVQETTPSGVRLDADCAELFVGRCDVRHVVQVPPSFEVVVTGSIGDVTAHRLTGPLTVDRSTGDLGVYGLAGPLDLRTTTGQIHGRELNTDVVRAVTDTGDVRMSMLAAPRSLEVTSTTGDVELAVPGDVGYRVDARTGTGEERVLVPVDPGSPRVLDIDGETGDLHLYPTR